MLDNEKIEEKDTLATLSDQMDDIEVAQAEDEERDSKRGAIFWLAILIPAATLVMAILHYVFVRGM